MTASRTIDVSANEGAREQEIATLFLDAGKVFRGGARSVNCGLKRFEWDTESCYRVSGLNDLLSRAVWPPIHLRNLS